MDCYLLLTLYYLTFLPFLRSSEYLPHWSNSLFRTELLIIVDFTYILLRFNFGWIQLVINTVVPENVVDAWPIMWLSGTIARGCIIIQLTAAAWYVWMIIQFSPRVFVEFWNQLLSYICLSFMLFRTSHALICFYVFSFYFCFDIKLKWDLGPSW